MAFGKGAQVWASSRRFLQADGSFSNSDTEADGVCEASRAQDYSHMGQPSVTTRSAEEFFSGEARGDNPAWFASGSGAAQ